MKLWHKAEQMEHMFQIQHIESQDLSTPVQPTSAKQQFFFVIVFALRSISANTEEPQ
jgi:hypothetical protein